ncbi:hypothetical protein [Streptomyces gilvus]|uniref:hypothetical protein n=1 Tax=Streptomyces gilvus TaxID=2920937 RepID=UPI001F0DDD13|nr:hypothetical protein [Streptomyces sp. CME 23]MCH5677903.1 hypothetical protein [Streptomyces sp. CME 23]
MKKRLWGAAAAVAGTAALLVSTAPTASAALPLHHLMVYKPSAIHSVYINTTNPTGGSFAVCRTLSDGTGWVDGHFDLLDGAPLNLITFTSTDCTSGISISRNFTVPGSDGLANFWANMS